MTCPVMDAARFSAPASAPAPRGWRGACCPHHPLQSMWGCAPPPDRWCRPERTGVRSRNAAWPASCETAGVSLPPPSSGLRSRRTGTARFPPPCPNRADRRQCRLRLRPLALPAPTRARHTPWCRPEAHAAEKTRNARELVIAPFSPAPQSHPPGPAPARSARPHRQSETRHCSWGAKT